jgi:16S rRNA (guanine527-N7)-methyltransferase
LIKENKKVNLTSIVDKKDVYYKHFYDSLIVLKSISFNDNIYLCDIGSGAGFPGIVLKIFFPGIYLFIIESNQKKIKFLENLISLIKLKNVFLINKRAEIAIKQLREKFDFVCARAVAHLNILSELSIPFLKINGYFLA